VHYQHSCIAKRPRWPVQVETIGGPIYHPTTCHSGFATYELQIQVHRTPIALQLRHRSQWRHMHRYDHQHSTVRVGKIHQKLGTKSEITNTGTGVTRYPQHVQWNFTPKTTQNYGKKYPELQSFADLLYEQHGQTGVKMADGSWTYIPVQEGFSQGCHMLRVFAALVVGELLQEVDTHFRRKAASHHSQGADMDDHLGGGPYHPSLGGQCQLPLTPWRYRRILQDVCSSRSKMGGGKTKYGKNVHIDFHQWDRCPRGAP